MIWGGAPAVAKTIYDIATERRQMDIGFTKMYQYILDDGLNRTDSYLPLMIASIHPRLLMAHIRGDYPYL